MPVVVALDLVAASPRWVRDAMGRRPPDEAVRPGSWSPAEYLWHTVDVLRIGTERLWTLTLDPGRGFPAWDENELARVRRYGALSPQVAMRAYEKAVATWLEAARGAPHDAEAAHPEVGAITSVEVIRRNAHEVQHHLADILGNIGAS